MTTKGVIVAAGYGTRFLPVTRCIPKEMLPLVNRPCIDVIAEELEQAGIEQVLIISSRRKKALEDWFDRDPELESVFAAEGNSAKQALIQPRNLQVQVVRQSHMRGTGDALLLARAFAGDDPVVVAYPDDLFRGANCTAALIRAHQATGGKNVLSAVDLAGEDVSRYGVIAGHRQGDYVQVTGLVEKPPPGTEPSSWVSLGRYLFTPELFERLAHHRAHHQGPGEYQPAVALGELAAQGKVVATWIAAERRDTGTPLGYLKAVVEEGLEHQGIGPAFRAWLGERLG